YAYLARGVRDCVDVPVIASHRINDPETARELLDDGMCDLVAMGRGLIADPFLPQKADDGRENEIVHCIACGQGCFDALSRLTFVECLCNPKASYEVERRIVPADSPKKVMVVGGGPAGMSAALAASERGHEVVLYERNRRLGGQLHLASAPPGREEFAQLAGDLTAQLETKQVKIVLGRQVDAGVLEKEKPEAVILASGARPITPPIEGADGPNVVQAWDVLRRKARTGRKVVIVGGGAVGVETALFLADKGTLSADSVKFLLVNRAESGEDLFELATTGTKEIVLVEMLDRLGQDIGRTTRWGMMQDLSRHGVEMHTGTMVVEIVENGVRVKQNGEEELLTADTVILAAGSQSENSLEQPLKDLGVPYRVIGDAGQVAQAFEAIRDGFLAGREI
ncbi:MAG: FAD-dependent oxidoreductase, partial [Proteobacteria bacterium]|nr:FAD-dependent oxidoreductase [Pseudomonadota bacterium]